MNAIQASIPRSEADLEGGEGGPEYLKSKKVSKVVLASGENAEELRNDPQFASVDHIVNEKIPTSFKEFFS